MEKNNINPNEMELLDLWNEVGGQMVIKYHRATIRPTKEDLQKLREGGFKTDVNSCVILELYGHGMSKKEVLDFFGEAEAAGAAPSVSFEAAEGEALNISSPEENPMVDALVQAISDQNQGNPEEQDK